MAANRKLATVGIVLALSVLQLGRSSAHEQQNTVVSGGVTYFVSAHVIEPAGSYPAYSPEIPFYVDFQYRITHDAGVGPFDYYVGWGSYLDGMVEENVVGGDFQTFTVDAGDETGPVPTEVNADGGPVGVAPGDHNADGRIQIRHQGVDQPILAQQWDGHIFQGVE